MNNVIKIITTTHTLKKYYVNKCRVNYNKIKVLHNASPLIPKKKPSFLPKSKFNIGFFGTIYKSRGLIVIGVPSNSFNQEKNSNNDVKKFCEFLSNNKRKL